MYKVIEMFEDLQDGRHLYEAGDIFPRDGVEVSEARIGELSSDKNRRKKPLIQFVEDTEDTEDTKDTEDTEDTEKKDAADNTADAEAPKRRGRKKSDTPKE